MSRERGHGDLQGGISLTLLSAPPPSAFRLRLRAHPLLGARRVALPRAGKLFPARASAFGRDEVARRRRLTPTPAAVCAADVPRVVAATSCSGARRARSHAVGRHL